VSRHVRSADGGYLIETINKWDQGNSYSYTIDESSEPINKNSYAKWSAKGDDKNSIVRFEVNYSLKYGIIGKAINGLFATSSIKTFMLELKDHVERDMI